MSALPDFRLLFESVPALIMVLATDSPRFTILAASDAYLRATKLRREDMVGKPVFEVFPENPDQPAGAEANSRASFERVLQRRLPDRQAVQQHDIRRPDLEGGGFETRFWSPLNTPVLDENGAVRYIIHCVEDVSELVLAKQQAEQEEDILERRSREIALIRREADISREREQRYAALFESSPSALALIRMPAETIVEVNDAFLRLFRCNRNDVIGKAPTDSGIISPETQSSIRTELLQHGSVRSAEFIDRTTSGEVRTLSFNLNWIGIGGERLLLGTIEDITERKRAEGALRESEERLRAVLENMSEGLMLFDSQSNLIYQNPASLRIHGFNVSEEGLIEHENLPTTWDAWDEQGRPIRFDEWPVARVFTGERFQNQVLHVRRVETGQEFDGSYNGSPIYDASGKLTLGFITIRDISEQVRATKALKQSEARLRQAQLAANIGAFEWNIKTGLVEWSPEMEALYGLPPGGFEGKYEAWTSFVHPEDINEVERFIQAALEHGEFNAEWRIIRPDGAVRWLAARAQVFKDSAGNPQRMVGVNMDITEQRKVEEEARNREALLNAIIDSVPVGLIIAEADGKLVRMNRANLEFWGVPPETTRWQEYEHWVGYWPETGERVKAHEWPLARTLLTGEPVSNMIEIEQFGTRLRRFGLLNAAPVRDNGGNIIGGVVAQADVTERVRAEQALRESEARLRAAISSMVDEIWFTDAQGNIILTNDAAIRNLGFGKREDFFQNIQQALAELEVYEPGGTPRPPEQAPLPRALRGEVLNNYEELVRNIRTGQLRFREVSSSPVHDEQGAIIGSVAVVRDVTERKNIERELRMSEERYRALFTSIDEGFCIIEVRLDETGRATDYRFVAINPAFERHTGISNALGRWMREIAPNHEEHWFESFGKVALTGESVRFQNYADVLERYFDVYAFRIGEPAERLVAILFSDITERRKTEEELKLAATVFQSSSEAIVITDADTRIVAVNPAFEKITGYKPEEVIGKNPSILKSGHHDRAFYEAFWRELNATGSWKGELWNRSKKGEIFVVLTSINTTWNPDGSVQRRVAVITDITEKKRSEELVWQQANFDALTGLPNRRLFQDHLQQDIKKARRSRLPLALMFMDLDGFKDVNDALGHEAGDVLLKETGQRVLSCVRETDTVARLGGDEFTVILTELTNLAHVSAIAQLILQKVAEPYQIGEEVAHVSGSIGITLFPQDASGMEELLINADQAMYAAKAAGKDRFSFFTEAMQHAAHERTWLVNELRNAIENRQFRLVYQPIVELASGCINKAEALLRWDHPERGPIDPTVFIPVAEETGMIRDLGDWVFVEAANQAAQWRKTYHPDFQISINKSPVQFKSRGGDVSYLLDNLKRLNLPGQSIAIEITEGVLMDESQTVIDQLLAFRDAGIEVSLDDFGTGYSTLSYLKRFDIDRLKIDQIFIHNLENDPDDLALCEAMIVMGHKLGIQIVAEGVETVRQQELLADAGCDFVQGYLLAGPLSADELGGLLKKGSLYCPGPSMH